MSTCCSSNSGDQSPLVVSRGVSRRAVLQRLTATMGATAALAALPAYAKGGGKKIKLAFCSQLLCVVPYEATRAAGFFADQGLDVELVYSRGGSAALQALNSGGVDYAATSFDAALNAFVHKAGIQRFATTGRLPLFALATSPKTADSIQSISDLKGKTVGVAQLGNADYALTVYLLKRAGVDPKSVQFATLGPNLYDALRLGQVDAGMVQEPGLTLLERGGAKVLANLMDLKDAEHYLGGPYAFMGVAIRAGELDQRRDEMKQLGKALAAGLEYTRSAPIADLVKALPDALIAGGNTEVLTAALDKHRESLYPERVQIDRNACQRVVRTELDAGILTEAVDLDHILNTSVLGA